MRARIFILVLFGLILSAFVSVDKSLFEAPHNWPKPAYDFSKNPLSKEKILLGRVLFYDPILSINNTTSCASCHSPYAAFTHVDHALSHGIYDSIGTRNSPALMNLAWHSNYMWDGSINHLDMQALAPISHPSEMGENISHVVQKLGFSNLYPALFYNAFGDSVITGARTLKAISQFMLILISSNAKYDSVMRNEATFNNQEKKGYLLFKRNCASCHSEPLFTSLKFENNGLAVDATLMDFGRIRVTKTAKDSLLFKVPTLRNIEFSFPYMHDGRFKTIKEVLNHYTSHVIRTKTLSKQLLQPIVLNSNEKVELTSFLLTLTDKSFLFNKDYSYPKFIFFPKAKE